MQPNLQDVVIGLLPETTSVSVSFVKRPRALLSVRSPKYPEMLERRYI
jgi:hypothetical protein